MAWYDALAGLAKTGADSFVEIEKAKIDADAKNKPPVYYTPTTPGGESSPIPSGLMTQQNIIAVLVVVAVVAVMFVKVR
jgi:hypothetical protein